MAKRSDFIADILNRRSRHPKRTERWLQFMKRAEGLLLSLHHVGNKAPKKHSCQAELLRYFPIGITAASEGYFRLVYRDLIDFGDPYLRNAANFKDLSLGHEAIYAIHGRQTSIGEIISHQLSHNNLGDIIRNMDALTGGDFKAAVEQELASQNPLLQGRHVGGLMGFAVRRSHLRVASHLLPRARDILSCPH
jgi:hypothetical protein